MKKIGLNNGAIANKLIAIFIVFCMIFVQYAIVGSNIVSAVAEELESQQTITKGENVEFEAFFRDGNNSVHEAKLNLEETQKLYIEVAVKDKVSAKNAVIKIEDANFNIKKDEMKDNRYVSDVNTETNEIQLKNISSNNTALIEIPIEFKKQEKTNSGYFEKEVNITLKGNTEDINQHMKDLQGNVKIRPLWTANTELNLTQSIDKYFSLGDKGIILQQTVKSEVKNNALPRYKEVIQTEAPTVANEKPERVTVLVDGEKVDDNNVEYNNGTVKVTYSKIDDSDGNIEWGDAKKEYTFMYHYNSTTPLVETPIKLNTKVESSQYTKDDNVTKEDTTEIVATPIGNITTVETTLTGDIYKGYLYENEAKELQYVERNDIDVSYIEGIENIQLQTNNNTYANEAGIGVISAQNITYKQTQVNKKEILKLLGQEGKVTIKRATGEVITEITKDTQEDEKGVITVEYPEGETGIVIETTKPQVEGKMTVLNTKAISGVTNQPRTAISLIKQLIVNPEIITNVSKEGTTASLEMKEPTTEASIEVNRTSLTTTQENQKIEIKAMLNTNDAKQDLYANPSLAIELPSDIQSVNVESIDKLYGDEFTDVRASQGVVNGKQVIRIDLIGEQKEHKDAGVKGTVLNINANVTLNKKATNKQDNIKMVYSNAKANQYKDAQPVGMAETPIEIISPKALITTNNIASLDIQTVGEQEGVTKTIERGTESKQFTVESEIINNNSAEIKDVKILGTFGTQGIAKIGKDTYENNINSMLTSELSIESVDMSKVRIYYTENEEATDDLEDINNRWQPTVANAGATKKYLVVVSKMDVAEQIKLNYNIVVPENLTYDKQMYQGYTVKYNDDQLISEHESKATTIELKTKEGPKIEATLSAKVGSDTLTNGMEVKRGEIIEYNVTTSNVGDENVENAKVKVDIPEETTLIEREEERGEYTEKEDRTKEFEIGEIQAGESKTIKYKVTVNQQAEKGKQIRELATVQYNEQQLNTEELTAVIDNAEGGIKAQIFQEHYETDKTKEGEAYINSIYITNTTEEEIKNIKVKWDYPNEFKFINQIIDDDTQIPEPIEDETITIDSLQPGEKKKIVASFEVSEIEQNMTINISARVIYGGDEYRTNHIESVLQDIKDCGIRMTSEPTNNSIINMGDEIVFDIEVENYDDNLVALVTIEDTIPSEMTISSAILKDNEGNSEEIQLKGNEIACQTILNPREKKHLILTTKLLYKENVTENKIITNKAELYNLTNLGKKSGEAEVGFTIVPQGSTSPSPQGPGTQESTEPSTQEPGTQESTEPSTQEPSTQESTSPSTQEPSTQESTSPSTQEPSTQESTSPSPQEPGTQESAPPSTQEPETINTKISGYAWTDENLNGAKDNNENTVPNIKVRLLNAKTNELLKDENEKIIEVYTDDTGLYTFENVPIGQYIVVFEYDVTSYELTDYMKEGVTEEVSSKAVSKSLDIDGEEKTYAVTEVITIGEKTQISNINIGLVTTGKFDLQLDKYVSKITINNKDGVKSYTYDKENLAKVEIDRKKMDGTTVTIEYDIVVTNAGEVSGYAKTVEDEIPADLTFSQELNKEWTQTGSTIRTNSIENEVIAPGESKVLKLVLTKVMTDDNTGIVTNNAEITESYNEEGIEDINSIPGNGVQYENDYSTSDTIIGIKTGSSAVYVTLILIILGMIGIGIFFIRKETLETVEIDENIFKIQ